MKNDKKYKRLNARSRGYALCGVGSKFIGYWADLHDNDCLSNLMTVIGATTSVASMVNFIRSLDYFEVDDVDLFYIKHMVEMRIMPVVDSLSLAFSLMPKDKKISTVNALKKRLTIGDEGR